MIHRICAVAVIIRRALELVAGVCKITVSVSLELYLVAYLVGLVVIVVEVDVFPYIFAYAFVVDAGDLVRTVARECELDISRRIVLFKLSKTGYLVILCKLLILYIAEVVDLAVIGLDVVNIVIIVDAVIAVDVGNYLYLVAV